MKMLFWLLTLLPLATNATGLSRYEAFSMSPMTAGQRIPYDERLIEPTSPILGKSLAAAIRGDERHPEEVLKILENEYPGLKRELRLSALTYFKTMEGPLKEYCTTEQTEGASDAEMVQVDRAAIPTMVLLPLHGRYLENLTLIQDKLMLANNETITSFARREAQQYQAQRYDCLTVKKLEGMENKIKKIFPPRYDGLVDLNHVISSPEAAFPRVQFSVNGFTQYVFDELFRLEYGYLARLMKVVYEAELEWVDRRALSKKLERYGTFVESKALKAGFMPREILLALSYSNRNMPSLDVQYGYDTDKALMLEVYFWKFRHIRDFVTDKYLNDLFPNVVMKSNPGLYHYMTAALLACDIKLNGYSGFAARFLAIVSKVGYKVHKLLGEVDIKEIGIKGIKNVLEIAKRQGFKPGVDAGRHGGNYGLKMCLKHTPKEKWIKNIKKDEHEVNDIFDADDLPVELEALL